MIHVWKIYNGLAPNDVGFEFQTHQRFGVKATIPPINTKAQVAVRVDYDKSFRVKAAQLYNLLPPELKSIPVLGSADSWNSFQIPHQPGATLLQTITLY